MHIYAIFICREYHSPGWGEHGSLGDVHLLRLSFHWPNSWLIIVCRYVQIMADICRASVRGRMPWTRPGNRTRVSAGQKLAPKLLNQKVKSSLKSQGPHKWSKRLKIYKDKVNLKYFFVTSAVSLFPGEKYRSPYFYRPQRSCGQGNILHLSVILFTGGGGVCLSACWDTTPGTRHTLPPPEADSGIRSMSGRYASYWNAFLWWIKWIAKHFDSFNPIEKRKKLFCISLVYLYYKV